MKKIEEPTRLFDLLPWWRMSHIHRPALRYGNREFSTNCAASELQRRCDLVSYALLSTQLRRGEGVAVVSDDLPEFLTLGMGALQTGAVLLPLETTLTAETYIDLINRAHVRILLLDNGDLLRRFKMLLPQMPGVVKVFTLEPCNEAPSTESLFTIGQNKANPQALANRTNLITTDDICLTTYATGYGTISLTHKEMLKRIA